MLAVCFVPAVTAATTPSGPAGGVMGPVSGLYLGRGVGGEGVLSSCGFQFYSSELKPQLLDGFKKSNDFVDYLAFSFSHFLVHGFSYPKSKQKFMRRSNK